MDTYDKVYRQVDRASREIPGRVGRDMKTWGEVFDAPTVMSLHKMLRSGVIKSIDYPLKTGKEANVFKGTMEDGEDCAIKIYRVHTATFRHILKYIEGDPRFRSVGRDHREMIFAWARKEYRNLQRFREANVDVPIPYKHLNNILVMEYLSNLDGPARSMKEDPPQDPPRAFEKLWEDYKRALGGARLIHSDLSEYNVMMPHGEPRIIDVGQAVLDNHPMAKEFLARDIKVIAKYFRGFDVETDEEEMLATARAILKTHEGKEIDDEQF
jgi:RIO kinase 1